MTADLGDVKESVDDLDNSFEGLSDDLSTVMASVDILENDVIELSDNFEGLTEELDDIIGHDNSTDSEIDELKDQVADLATDLNNLDVLGPDFKMNIATKTKRVLKICNSS